MSVDLSVLSPGFAEFAALGHYSVRQKLDAVEIAEDPGGEIRFYIREPEPGVFVLSEAERSGDEEVIMWSPDPVDLERYLTRVVGGSARQWLGLGRLKGLIEAEQLSDRFDVRELETRVFALQPVGAALLLSRFPYLGVAAPIVQFAQVAGLDLEAMRRAYLDPEGRPFFSLWAKPHQS